MEAMRQSWTDDRLDDFRAHVDQRFDDVDQRFNEVDRRFDQVNQRFEQVDMRFEQVDRRFEWLEAEIRMQRSEISEGFRALQRATIQIGAGIFGTLMLTIFTMFATHG
ncbi:MAG: hypothetical protein ACM3N0_01820 [Chloroflexota bacterium]